MKKLYSLSLSLILIFSSYNSSFSQDYCTQAEALNIDAPGACSSTSIALGADFDDQDDNAGDANIDVTTSCVYPGASANAYWGSFVGNGNAVTLKLIGPNNDATMVVFENTPCGGNMTAMACIDVVDDGAGGIVINTINGATYTIAIYRQSGSSSMTGELSIVDNPSNTPYYAACDPCINATPSTINVHSQSIDCFSDFTQLDIGASGLAIDGGNPIPVDGCGTSDDWDWATFTATETVTNLFLFGQSSDNIPFLVTEGPCSASMSTVICDDTGDKDLGASFPINTTPGETYHVFIRASTSRNTRICAFNNDSEPDKPFCSGGLSFEDGTGAGWSGFNGSYHLASAPGIDLIWDMTPGQIAGRFELTSGGFDPNIGAVLPKVAPGGGNFSFRIGSDANSTDPISGVTFPGSVGESQPSAEMMSYSFVVDPNNAGFGFKYATVMDFANHDEDFQPTFAVTIYDDNGDTINCADYALNPTDGYTQFYSVGDDGDVSGALSGVIFSPWQDVATDLSGYAGQTVTVDFKVKDCHGNATCSSNDPSCANFCANCQTGQCQACLQAGTHFAYAYFDTYCTPMNIDMPDFCAGAASIQICAPAGYASYDWPTGQPGMQAPFNQQCLTINNPVAGDVYTVNMTTINGCLVTRTIELQEIPSATTGDTTICPGSTIDLSISPLGTNGPYTFSWSPGGSTNSSITVTPAVTTTYSVTVTNGTGCSSTFDMLVTVDVCTPTVIGNDETICEGDCVDLAVTTSNTTGAITYSWSPNIGNTAGPINVCPVVTTDYIVTIVDGAGQTDKDTLTVTVNPIYNLTETVNVCENTSHTYPDGTSATITGNTSFTSNLTTGAGCDSIIVTTVVMDPISNSTEAVSVCQNQTHTYPDGTTASITGNTSYTSTLSSTAGCDSIIVTTVTMIPNVTNAITIGVCSGTNYTYADGTTSTNILVTENHVSTLVSGAGCDSVLTETLNIVTTVTNTVNVDICSGTDYTYADGTTSFGITSNETNVTTLITGGGCDSVITENVNVLAPNTVTTNPTICTGASITVGSSTYNATGVFTDVLVDANNCDSTITTNLTVLVPNVVTTNPVICTGQSHSVGSSSYNATGTFTDVLTDANGCDSTITTNLTVSTADDATFNYPGASICISTTDPSPAITGLAGGTFSIDNGGMINASTGVINLTGSGAGSYTVTYSTNGPCPNLSTFAIVITSLDDASFTYSSASYCIDATNPTPTITGVTGGTFTIDNGGTINATTGEINIAASGTGAFNITYTTVGACSNSSIQAVTIAPLDNANFTFSAANYCISGTNPVATITGGVSGVFSIDNGGVINSATGEIDLSASGAGTYIIDFITTGACPNSSSVTIAIDALDDASFSYGAVQYCNNDPFPLPSITGVSGGIFTISNGGIINASTGEIDVSASGLGSFTITYNTNTACAGSSTYDITIINCSPPIANFTVSDSTICAGDCIDLTDQSVFGASVLWTIPGGTPDSSTSLNPTICFPDPGTFVITLTVTNPFGTSTKTINIDVNTTPNIDAGPDITIPLGATTPLSVTGANTYLWSPSQFLNCSSCSDPIAAVTANTTFVVIATDDNGCIGRDTVNIIIDGEIEIFIPNIFSPNGDGENDVFKVYGSSFPSTYRMQIYNRWGGLVFESEDENINWDGTKDGEEIPQAVFVYKFYGISIVGLTFEKSGNVMLTR